MKLLLIAITIFALTMTLLTTTGCRDQASGSQPTGQVLQGKLVLTGSSTIAPLAGEIAKRFEQLHPGVRVDVQTGGSSRGIADTKRGTADIGMASRILKPEETDLTAHTIAMDGVGLILHRDNPIQSLTNEQIVAIYTGRLKKWSDVGGADAPITVVNKAEGRATLEVFLQYYGLSSSQIKPSIIIGDNQQAIRTVASDINAIAYVSIGTVDYAIGRDVPIRLMPIHGVDATIANVRNGSYPMTRPLNLVTHATPSPLAQAFIEYARSAAVNDLVSSQYFVSIAD